MAARVAALAPVYSRALAEIHARSPKATIVLIGYPTVSRPGGCPATQPAWPQDVDYLRGVLDKLNQADQNRSRRTQRHLRRHRGIHRRTRHVRPT